MTKPHTTLSEAVRALELPEPEYIGSGGNLGYTEGMMRTLLSAAADLIEQHEAQEPFGHFRTKKNSDGTTWTFETRETDPDSFLLYAQPTLTATQAGDAKDALALAYGYLWHVGAGIDAPPECRVLTIPTEEAARRARKALFGLLTHEQRGEGICAVIAAMSPTPTRSE